MPPLPKPTGSKARGSTGTSGRTAGGGTRTGSSSTPPPAAPRGRVTKTDMLREDLARFYLMAGTMVRPFGRFYPVLTPVGDNLKEFSEEAADAWIQLAEKDARVKDILISMTGASVWGNVIGIHLAIFASALPGALPMFAGPSPSGPTDEDIMNAFGNLSPEEIALARQFAAGMQEQDVPARDHSTGGPGDTVRVQNAPEYSGEQVQTTAAPPAVQSVSRPAIVSAEQLGVQNIDPAQFAAPFPTDATGPNGSGG